MFPGDPNGGGAGRKAIMQQIEGSLRRLGTDYIDLYWQHNWDRHTPLEETIATLNDLVRAGKIRYVGLSDTPAWAVARTATIAELRGWVHVSAIQVEYSLLRRTAEGELSAPHANSDSGSPRGARSPVACCPANTPARTPPPTARDGPGRPPGTSTKTFAALDLLRRISDELGASMAAVALAWVRQQAEVTSTIIGARTVEQLDANLASLDITIPDQQLAELDEVTRPRLEFPAELLKDIAPSYQQAGATINGVESSEFRL